MSNQQLNDYIQHSRQSGKTDDEIKTQLAGAGWSAEDVKNAFSGNHAKNTMAAGVASHHRGGKMPLISIIVAAVLLIGGGAAAYYFYSSSVAQPEPPVVNTNTPPVADTNDNGDTDVVAPIVSTDLESQGNINKFTSQEELEAFLEDNIAIASSYGFGSSMRMDGGFSGAPVADVMARPAPVSSGVGLDFPSEFAGFSEQSIGSFGSDYSQTNVQVEGVDESDIVKTDGKYVYVVSKENLYIADAYPAENAQVLSKIEFKSRPTNIYINGDSLVVFGVDNTIYDKPIFESLPRSSYTYFKVFDISDRSNPKQVRDLDFEGNYSNSRMIGDHIYFLTSKYLPGIGDPVPLPRIIANGERIINDPDEPGYIFPDTYYLSIPYYAYNLTNIASINVKDHTQNITNEVYVLDGNQNIYVSQNNLYISYTKRVSEEELMIDIFLEVLWDKLSDGDKKRVQEIKDAPVYILSPQEKAMKIMMMMERYEDFFDNDELDSLEEQFKQKAKEKYQEISEQLERTVVHKIAISNGDIEYQKSGDVKGHVLDQFSMDEHNGYLRVATTKSREWGFMFDEIDTGESYSNVYVLDENLNQVGAVEKLAPGERIFASRFMQGRVYLVTFRQTDPFFVIDLKDPRNPKVLGELKIPGFSDYLHPYDENTIIGIGKDTEENENGRVITKGLKLSLFNVSQVTNPREIAKFVFDDTSSDSAARKEHKAFLFSKDKNLIVIPVTMRKFDEAVAGILPPPFKSSYFRGAAVFSVTPNSITLTGLINHDDGSTDRDYSRNYYSYYDTTVLRSLYIDDVLYTVSNKFLKMNRLPTIDDIKTLELKKGGSDDFNVVN